MPLKMKKTFTNGMQSYLHEFARDFQYAFLNDVRQSKSYDYHLNWAEKVPRQHMKSEIIIKIHRVFNSLQKVQ